jgi:MFS family permease
MAANANPDMMTASERSMGVSLARWYPGWNMVAVAILFQSLVFGVVVSSFAFWAPYWMSDFAASRALIMTVAASTLAVSALVAPLAGLLLEHRPLQQVLVGGLSCLAAGMGLTSLARAFWPFAFIYSITMGIALTLAGPLVAQTLVVRWFGIRRGLANGIAVCGAPLGGVLVPPALALLMSHFGWRTVSLFVSLASLALIPLMLRLIRESPAAAGVAPEPEGPVVHDLGRTWTIRELIAAPSFWILILIFLPTYGACMALAKNFALIFADQRFDAGTAALAYSFMNIFSIIGKVIIGKLSDRYDNRGLMFICVTIAAVGFTIMAGHAGLGRLIAGSVAISAGSACFFPMQGVIIVRYFGRNNFTRVLGLLNFVFLFGALASPLAGRIRDVAGSYDPFLIGAAILLPLAAIFVFRLPSSNTVWRPL